MLIACLAWLCLIGFSTLVAEAQTPAADAGSLVRQGVSHARAKRFPQAIICFEHALAADPENRDAHYNLALALYNSGDSKRSIDEFEQALAKQPDALDAKRGLGLAQLALRRYSSAIASLTPVVGRAPDDAAAWGALGRAYMGVNQPVRAAEALRRASKLRPHQAGLAYELGKAEALAGNHNEARQAFYYALVIKPDSSAAAVGLARAHMATGAKILAIDVLKPFAAKPNPDPEVLRVLIEAYDGLMLEDDALRTRERLAGSLSGDEAAEMHMQIANAYLERKRWGEAKAQLELAMVARPGNADALVGLAKCYHEMGDAGNALSQWQAASALAPDRIDISLGLAGAFSAGSDDDAAVAALERALQTDPNHPEALRMAADLSAKLGRPAAAEGYLRRILAGDPRNFGARLAVVDALVARGQPVKALLEAGEALRAPEPTAEAYRKVAALAEQLGNIQLAIATWQDLLANHGPDQAASLALGRLLVADHRVPEAIEAYQIALRQHPGHPDLTVGLADAYQSIGRDGQAAALLKLLIAQHPELLRARLELAESLAWYGETAEARALVMQALSAGKLDEQGCRTLALVFKLSGQAEAAVALLERLVPDGAPEQAVLDALASLYESARIDGGHRLAALFDEHPDHPQIGMAAARLLAQDGKAADADALLRQVARVPQANRQALRELVVLHATIGSPELALAPLRELVEPDPNTAWVIAALAELKPRPDLATQVSGALAQMAQAQLRSPGFWVAASELARLFGRVPVVLARMQGLAALTPDDPGLQTAVAFMALMDGRPDVARRAIAAVPNDRRADRVLFHTLARAQEALGETANAMSSLRHAMRHGPGAPEDHVLYAKLLRQSRQIEEALWHLVCALQIDPTDAPAQAGIREIIEADELPVDVILDGLSLVYYYRPDAAALPEFVRALSQRVDAQETCAEWIKLHPVGETVPSSSLTREAPVDAAPDSPE